MQKINTIFSLTVLLTPDLVTDQAAKGKAHNKSYELIEKSYQYRQKREKRSQN